MRAFALLATVIVAVETLRVKINWEGSKAQGIKVNNLDSFPTCWVGCEDSMRIRSCTLPNDSVVLAASAERCWNEGTGDHFGVRLIHNLGSGEFRAARFDSPITVLYDTFRLSILLPITNVFVQTATPSFLFPEVNDQTPFLLQKSKVLKNKDIEIQCLDCFVQLDVLSLNSSLVWDENTFLDGSYVMLNIDFGASATVDIRALGKSDTSGAEEFGIIASKTVIIETADIPVYVTLRIPLVVTYSVTFSEPTSISMVANSKLRASVGIIRKGGQWEVAREVTREFDLQYTNTTESDYSIRMGIGPKGVVSIGEAVQLSVGVMSDFVIDSKQNRMETSIATSAIINGNHHTFQIYSSQSSPTSIDINDQEMLFDSARLSVQQTTTLKPSLQSAASAVLSQAAALVDSLDKFLIGMDRDAAVIDFTRSTPANVMVQFISSLSVLNNVLNLNPPTVALVLAFGAGADNTANVQKLVLHLSRLQKGSLAGLAKMYTALAKDTTAVALVKQLKQLLLVNRPAVSGILSALKELGFSEQTLPRLKSPSGTDHSLDWAVTAVDSAVGKESGTAYGSLSDALQKALAPQQRAIGLLSSISALLTGALGMVGIPLADTNRQVVQPRICLNVLEAALLLQLVQQLLPQIQQIIQQIQQAVQQIIQQAGQVIQQIIQAIQNLFKSAAPAIMGPQDMVYILFPEAYAKPITVDSKVKMNTLSSVFRTLAGADTGSYTKRRFNAQQAPDPISDTLDFLQSPFAKVGLRRMAEAIEVDSTSRTGSSPTIADDAISKMNSVAGGDMTNMVRVSRAANAAVSNGASGAAFVEAVNSAATKLSPKACADEFSRQLDLVNAAVNLAAMAPSKVQVVKGIVVQTVSPVALAFGMLDDEIQASIALVTTNLAKLLEPLTTQMFDFSGSKEADRIAAGIIRLLGNNASDPLTSITGKLKTLSNSIVYISGVPRAMSAALIRSPSYGPYSSISGAFNTLSRSSGGIQRLFRYASVPTKGMIVNRTDQLLSSSVCNGLQVDAVKVAAGIMQVLKTEKDYSKVPSAINVALGYEDKKSDRAGSSLRFVGVLSRAFTLLSKLNSVLDADKQAGTARRTSLQEAFRVGNATLNARRFVDALSREVKDTIAQASYCAAVIVNSSSDHLGLSSVLLGAPATNVTTLARLISDVSSVKGLSYVSAALQTAIPGSRNGIIRSNLEIVRRGASSLASFAKLLTGSFKYIDVDGQYANKLSQLLMVSPEFSLVVPPLVTALDKAVTSFPVFGKLAFPDNFASFTDAGVFVAGAIGQQGDITGVAGVQQFWSSLITSVKFTQIAAGVRSLGVQDGNWRRRLSPALGSATDNSVGSAVGMATLLQSLDEVVASSVFGAFDVVGSIGRLINSDFTAASLLIDLRDSAQNAAPALGLSNGTEVIASFGLILTKFLSMNQGAENISVSLTQLASGDGKWGNYAAVFQRYLDSREGIARLADQVRSPPALNSRARIAISAQQGARPAVAVALALMESAKGVPRPEESLKAYTDTALDLNDDVKRRLALDASAIKTGSDKDISNLYQQFDNGRGKSRRFEKEELRWVSTSAPLASVLVELPRASRCKGCSVLQMCEEETGRCLCDVGLIAPNCTFTPHPVLKCSHPKYIGKSEDLSYCSHLVGEELCVDASRVPALDQQAYLSTSSSSDTSHAGFGCAALLKTTFCRLYLPKKTSLPMCNSACVEVLTKCPVGRAQNPQDICSSAVELGGTELQSCEAPLPPRPSGRCVPADENVLQKCPFYAGKSVFLFDYFSNTSEATDFVDFKPQSICGVTVQLYKCYTVLPLCSDTRILPRIRSDCSLIDDRCLPNTTSIEQLCPLEYVKIHGFVTDDGTITSSLRSQGRARRGGVLPAVMGISSLAIAVALVLVRRARKRNSQEEMLL